MSTPFLSEIKLVSFNFAPRGWAMCNGQLLPINQNQALFSLLGTTYGGDGRVTFALPDLRARMPMHTGAGHGLGERAGEESHTLTAAELPAHQHGGMKGSNDLANANVAGGALPAARVRGAIAHYGAAGSADVPMNPASVSGAGGGQPHNNMQPYLALNYVIALQGIFPSQN